MNHWNRRIALAAVLAAFSAPALAADPAKDCTVCSDPTWPNLDNLMPGIGLNGPAETGKRPSPGGVAPWLAANYQSPGVGVAASDVASRLRLLRPHLAADEGPRRRHGRFPARDARPGSPRRTGQDDRRLEVAAHSPPRHEVAPPGTRD